jgi:hypothetical protein
VTQPVVTAEPRALRKLVVTAILAAAVGAAAGFAAGNQLGERSKPQQRVFAADRDTSASVPFGVVTKRDGNSVTITSYGRDIVVEADDSTVVSKADAAALADIAEGDTVVVSGRTDAGVVKAKEIVVLPTQWVLLLGQTTRGSEPP